MFQILGRTSEIFIFRNIKMVIAADESYFGNGKRIYGLWIYLTDISFIVFTHSHGFQPVLPSFS